jgi:hypothetical protein
MLKWEQHTPFTNAMYFIYSKGSLPYLPTNSIACIAGEIKRPSFDLLIMQPSDASLQPDDKPKFWVGVCSGDQMGVFVESNCFSSEAEPQTKILSTTDGHGCTQIKTVLRMQQNLT